MVEALQPSAVKTSAKRDKSDIKRELYWALHNGYHTYFEVKSKLNVYIYLTRHLIVLYYLQINNQSGHAWYRGR